MVGKSVPIEGLMVISNKNVKELIVESRKARHLIYLSLGTSLHIVFEHIRETLFKFKCDSFAHYADSIHCIYQRLAFGLKHIAK